MSMLSMMILGQTGGMFEAVKNAVNWLTQPSLFLIISTAVFVLMLVGYRVWTRPLIFWTVFLLFMAAYFGAMVDPNFRAIIVWPDNVPITMMIVGVAICAWVSFRRAAQNDERLAAGKPLLEEDKDDKVLTWPDLVYTELICIVIATAGLLLWSILIQAPLEQPADPGFAPNPAKAPWYFLGLQEMLVYFDPWMAGVVYPGLIIVGLCAMPYIDVNPRGNGYYTLRERPFAITVWMFGFLILWVVLIFFGTFLRGPNWAFFGPFEYWDPHKMEALNNVDLSHYFWIGLLGRDRPTVETNPIPLLPHWVVREWLGFLVVGAYLILTPALLRATAFKRMYENMGGIRYSIMIILLLFMALMPIKMVLRWVFNLKYFIYLPEFDASF